MIGLLVQLFGLALIHIGVTLTMGWALMPFCVAVERATLTVVMYAALLWGVHALGGRP